MPYTNDLNHNRSKEGVDTHTRTQLQQQHTYKSRRERKNQNNGATTKNTLKSLSSETPAWSQSHGVVVCSKYVCVIALRA
jgi:hypothetical protein